MGTLFSNLFMLFFMYIFPVIFSYMGNWPTNPWLATLGLALGLIGWILINTNILRNFIIKPGRTLRKIQNIETNGRRVQARVLSKSLLNRNKDGSEHLEIKLAFRNFNNTEIESKITLTDSKPHEDRFAKDRMVSIILSPDINSVPFVLDGSQYKRRFALPMFWVLFNLAYALAYFLISYHVYSKGMGWRFMAPWYPWVWQPYLGVTAQQPI